MPMTLEEHAEEIRTSGYTIVQNVINGTQLREARAALEDIFEREKDIGLERHWHNDVYKVAYMLPQKHPFFRSFAFNPNVLGLMRPLLGPGCMLASLNGFTMSPRGRNHPLHIDQFESVPGAVLSINALHVLDDFSIENGCTRVIPGSQDRVFNSREDAAAHEDEAVFLEAPAGSLIAFNGGLWHAGSRNSTDSPRRAIHAYYSRPWVRPQWDYTRGFTPDVVAQLTEEQKELFGFYAHSGWYDPESDQHVRPATRASD